MNIPILLGAFGLLGFCLYICFGDARRGERRRLLQNTLYRAYQVLAWASAVLRAADMGLMAYYQQREKQMPLPLNERRFPAQLEAPVVSAQQPLPEFSPWPDPERRRLPKMLRRLRP